MKQFISIPLYQYELLIASRSPCPVFLEEFAVIYFVRDTVWPLVLLLVDHPQKKLVQNANLHFWKKVCVRREALPGLHT